MSAMAGGPSGGPMGGAMIGGGGGGGGASGGNYLLHQFHKRKIFSLFTYVCQCTICLQFDDLNSTTRTYNKTAHSRDKGVTSFHFW